MRYLDTHMMEKPLEGTKFCSAWRVNFNTDMDWDTEPVDHCCLMLHRYGTEYTYFS